MKENSLISIITPCLNRVGFISKAVKSVLNQDYPHVEHIIIDGGSTDGTLEVLNRYHHLNVISEQDQGMYDAINKGIAIANGEIIGFLNTDDFYEPNIFGLIVQNFESNPEIDAVVGGAEVFERDTQGNQKEIIIYESPSQGELLNRVTEGTPIFNAWFFRSKSLKKIGDFNTQYLYTSDREYLIRFYMQKMDFESTDKILYHYRQHPSSITMSGDFDGEADWMFETLDLAETYISSKKLENEELEQFRSWHSQMINDMIVFSLKKKQFRRIWGYSQRGKEYNPYWLSKFLDRVEARFNRLV